MKIIVLILLVLSLGRPTSSASLPNGLASCQDAIRACTNKAKPSSINLISNSLRRNCCVATKMAECLADEFYKACGFNDEWLLTQKVSEVRPEYCASGTAAGVAYCISDDAYNAHLVLGLLFLLIFILFIVGSCVAMAVLLGKCIRKHRGSMQ